MKLDIRVGNIDDKELIVRFLHDHWDSNHIFVKDPRLLDYMHLNEMDKKYNFVIIQDIEAGELIALHGFITPSHFDNKLSSQDIFLAIWKAIESKVPGLGIRTLDYIQRKMNPRLIGAMGFDTEVTELYQKLSFSLGFLSHYVLFNPELKEFSIASGIVSDMLPESSRDPSESKSEYGSVSLILDEPANEIKRLSGNYIPEKSKDYLIGKYLNHPTYEYKCFKSKYMDQLCIIFIFRIIEIENSRILRIVDFLGEDNDLSRCNNAILKMLSEYHAEYIDLYTFGLSTENLEASNFILRQAFDDLVVPHYFEPFVRENIDLNYAIRLRSDTDLNNVRLFKGDGDQDRPSQIISRSS